MKNFNLIEMAKAMKEHKLRHMWRYAAMIALLLTLVCGNVWGTDTELVNIDLSSWSTQSVSAGGSVSGYYFKSASTITNGSGWVKTGNAANNQNYIGIPLSGINGSVTITVTHYSSRPTIGYQLVTGNSAYNGNYSHSSSSMSTTRIDPAGTTTTITINNLSGSYGHLILGATGNANNNQFYISNIVVTTPNANKRIYMKANGWNNDTPYFYAHSWGSKAEDALMTLADCETDVFYVDIPSGNNNILFTRQSTNSGIKYKDESGNYNQSVDINCSSNDQFTFNGNWNKDNSGKSDFNYDTYSAPTYTISFAANGGSGSMSNISSIACGANQELPANTFTKSGYTFDGWKADVAVTIGGASVAAGTKFAGGATLQNITSDIALTAQWEEVECPATGTIYELTVKSASYSVPSGVETNMVSDYATVTLGGAFIGSKSNNGQAQVKTDGSGTVYFNSNDGYVKLVLDCPIQTGDQLTFVNGSGDKQICFTTTNARNTTYQTSSNSYTFPATFNNASTIYVWRVSTSSTYMHSLTITRSAVCGATQPGAITGSLSSCNLTLTAAGSPASNNTWYWQNAANGTSTSESGPTKVVNSTGTYYIRSYYSTGTCWSEAQSITVTESDLTPAAPSALAKSAVTAKGVTLTVTDAASTNNYDFYVSTSSGTPAANATPVYSVASGTSTTITDLVAGTTYYAWARAKCGSYKSGWTALTNSTFTTSTVSAEYHPTNVTKTAGATSGIGGSDFTATFSANTDYCLPSTITVTIDGNTATVDDDYTWAAGTLTIPASKINGDIDITVNSAPAAPSSVNISGAFLFFPGETISLTATPTGGNGPTTYQWQKIINGNWTDITLVENATAQSANFQIADATISNTGNYRCVVTKGGTQSLASSQFDMKCLQLYTYYDDNSDHGNCAFERVDETHASVSVYFSNGGDYVYHFKVTDGLNNWYGNSGTMTGADNGPWSLDVNNFCGVKVGKAATYVFKLDFSAGIGNSMTMKVDYPSADQAAGKVIYFDNSVLTWSGSSIYYRVGHNKYNTNHQLTLVPGTTNLYRMKTSEFNGFAAWHIGNAAGETGENKSIYNTKNGTAITAATEFEGGAVLDTITLTPVSAGSYTGGDSQNNNCTFYKYGTASGMKTQTVTISSYSNGTITVNYVDTGNVARSFTSGSKALAHTVVLTSITAVPNTGYDAGAITINGDAYSANYVVTGATTIAASFTPQTYSITYKDQGDVAFSGTHTDTPNAHPTSHTYATATTLNSATKSGYTFGGWYENAACTGEAVTTLGATAYTADITLYAKWTAAPAPAGDCEDLFAGTATSTTVFTATTGSATPSLQTGASFSKGGYSYCVKPNQNGAIVATPKDGSSFAAGDSLIFVVYNPHDGEKTMGFNTASGTTSASVAVGNLHVFRRKLVAADISAGKVTFNRQSSDDRWVAITIKHCDAPSCTTPAEPTISGTTSYTEGDNISLTASHDGSNHDASTTYRWLKGDTWGAASEVQTAATGSAGYTFTKNSCAVGDAGTYWCEAANSTCKSHNASGYTITVSAGGGGGSCETWEGTPSSWTSSAMTVGTNMTLKAVGKDWDINSNSHNKKYAVVWYNEEDTVIRTLIAIDDHSATKYLQGSFADGSVIQSLTIGAANNNGTAGTNKKYVVLFSATEAFTNVLAYATDEYAQEITAPSYKDQYNASNLEKSITVPSGAKFFRIYRKVAKDVTIGDFTADKDYGDGQTIRIFKIEACPAGSACTNPTIEWDDTPANGVAGGTMTASVTSNYPAGVTYSSSDPTVATVGSTTGLITYVAAGSATITATVVGDGTTYCDLATDPSVSQAITVSARATGISVSPSSGDVLVGGTLALTAALTPAGAADETVVWSSEYENATVAGSNKSATVTGVALRADGKAFKIYAKTDRLTSNSYYASVRVYKGVTYDATTNGGTCGTASDKYYGNTALTLPSASKASNVFTGWYTTASEGGTRVGGAGDEYTPTDASTTLYARFEAVVSTYSITYDLNGGTHGTMHQNTGTPGTEHELSAPTRSGYTFAGWTVSPVGGSAKWGTTNTPTPSTSISDASTLALNSTYSVWFKDLAAANGSVTITAHWKKDCAGGGGGGSAAWYYYFTSSDDATANGVTNATTIFTSMLASTNAAGSNMTYSIGDLTLSSAKWHYKGQTSRDTEFATMVIPSGYTMNKLQIVVNPGGSNLVIKVYNASSVEVASTGTITNADGTTAEITQELSAGTYTVKFTGRDCSRTYAIAAQLTPTSGETCYNVTYDGNGADGGVMEDDMSYSSGATVTVKSNGFTKTNYSFLGWANSTTHRDAGTVDYEEDDTFTISSNVTLYAVWGAARPRVYALSGSAYRCTGDAASTITLAGSESGVSYQLKKDGVDEGEPESGTGSALSWSKTAWGVYTVVGTRNGASSTMSGEAVLSDYPLNLLNDLNGATAGVGEEVTLTARVSVNTDNSSSYTYRWYSNDENNYDSPTPIAAAATMTASTETQEFSYNPSTASSGTTYYFCEFMSPCSTVVRTRVVDVRVTSSTTTLTWDLDKEGDGEAFEELPQGGKHVLTVSSNSGVAPSLEVSGTDVSLEDIEQVGSTTTATLILGASAADVVLTAEVAAYEDYPYKKETKDVTVRECSSGETTLFSMHLTSYNAYTKDAGDGTATLSFASGKSVEYNDTTYEKPNSSAVIVVTLGTDVTLQAGDKVTLIMAGSGNDKTGCGFNFCKNGNTKSYGSIEVTLHERRTIETWTIPAGNALIGENKLRLDRLASDTRFYGMSITRGGGSGDAADIKTTVSWDNEIADASSIEKSSDADPFMLTAHANTVSNGTITYESTNTSVATISNTGQVTIKGTGTTVLKAKQSAIGCYEASAYVTCTLTVASCSEKEPVITYTSTVICPEGSQTLTATNYTAGATFQWYKNGKAISGATGETYAATDAGTYTVTAHKTCYAESSNSVMLTKASASVDVTTYADEFTIKSQRPYNFRLFKVEDGATMTVQSRTGIDEANSVVELNDGVITISGVAPTIPSKADATITIRITRGAGVCSGSAFIDKIVTIHKIPATAKKSVAWIATASDTYKGDVTKVKAAESTDLALYKELAKHYDMTACNCYYSTDEATLVKYYSPFDLIILTDYPNSKKTPSGSNSASRSYTNALGLLIDHIPMMTFEAFVAGCPNWGIPSNPTNTSSTQNSLHLLCNADDIFGTEGKYTAGADITVASVSSGQALQGFAIDVSPDFVFIAKITDSDGEDYVTCCERQMNPAARMMVFGLNGNTMSVMTGDGTEMVCGFAEYLLKLDPADIPDCSVVFKGTEDTDWYNADNWEGGSMPNEYASVRIDKPCEVGYNVSAPAKAGFIKIHVGTTNEYNAFTGSLTINPQGSMLVQKTITRVENNAYTVHKSTTPSDLVIEADDASHQGALIFNNNTSRSQATVEMQTKAWTDEGTNLWQYVAVPLVSASRWNMGDYAYKYDNASQDWSYYEDVYSAFDGVGLTSLESTPAKYTFEGELASTQTREITLYKELNMVGNSWTAPIHIVNFDEDKDFGGAEAIIYIYETGHDDEGGAQNATGDAAERTAGKWYSIPVASARSAIDAGTWNGMTVIPAMQAFEVKNEKGPDNATLTLDYNRLVRDLPASPDMNEQMRIQRRSRKANADIPQMRITMSDGKARNDVYLFAGERFSEGFDNGWDGQFMSGESRYAQLYALSPIGNLAISAQPEMEGTILGFAAGERTEYTITFRYIGEEELYLNDVEKKKSALITDESVYEFVAEAGESGNRFYISKTAIDAPQVPTGVTDLDEEAPKARKIIYNDKMYIFNNGRVFDAQGKVVK